MIAAWALGILLSLPTHSIAWNWFMETGPTLISGWSEAVVSSPQWLTSILYFPLTLLVVVGTEFFALIPLYVLIVLMLVWRRYIAKDTESRHTVRL